ncbi:unnamed protein product [Allacma fusca]|uniref:Uncharacterized protein n=1 Tax=Allacma fusca TaxID=39272 RepID=A0A8J2PU63_9HEXA|nr:unnamed protein product [Allacma fusca]
MQIVLHKLNQWMVVNSLTINSSKTKYLIFHKSSTVDTECKLHVNGGKIERVHSLEKLKFTEQPQLVLNEVTNAMGALVRVAKSSNNQRFKKRKTVASGSEEPVTPEFNGTSQAVLATVIQEKDKEIEDLWKQLLREKNKVSNLQQVSIKRPNSR